MARLKRTLSLGSVVLFGIAYMTPHSVLGTFGILADVTRGVVPSAYLVASVAMLFTALSYWNEWYLSSLYLGSTVEFKPLQYHLYNIINTANALRNSVAGSNVTITDPIDAGKNFLPAMNYSPGNAGDIVVVRVFYQWPLFVTGLGYNIANLAGSKRLLTATAAFRNEPF